MLVFVLAYSEKRRRGMHYHIFNTEALILVLHLTIIRFENRSGFVLFLFTHRMSDPTLNERSIDPDDAGTEIESFATADWNGKW